MCTCRSSYMGTLEIEAKAIRRRGEIRDALLLTLVIGGMIAMGAAPRAVIPQLGRKPLDARRYANHVRTAAGRLVQQGLATWVRRDGKVFLRITPAGKHKLEFMTEKLKLSKKGRRWDKRWRLVAFDIPERRRGTRTRLRKVMAEVGFVRLQDSGFSRMTARNSWRYLRRN